MMMLVGCPGTDGSLIPAEWFDSPEDGIKTMLSTGTRAIASAGFYGGIQVWVRDDGFYHCEFDRLRETVSEAVFKTLDEVRDWLVLWFPAMDSTENPA